MLNVNSSTYIIITFYNNIKIHKACIPNNYVILFANYLKTH